ncbi:MAG TPA: TIGR02680 family protein, partial [Actinocrinis sp.]|nr:TIGR02680 family protein [Actinocrinis sp.]
EYLTCGIGIKASKNSDAVTGSWRFVTAQRVGIDFGLVGPDDVPLELGELRKMIGDEAVYGSDESEGFQTKTSTLLYGIDEHRRYGDLLNLQRTLRNPDIGLRAVEGELERYLAQALPPLDPALVQSLAEKFSDLEAISENIKKLEAADTTLGRLMNTYRGYARGEYDRRADALRSARSAADKHSRAISEQQGKLAREQKDARAKKDHADKLRARERELTAQINGLEVPDQLRSIDARTNEVRAFAQTAAAQLSAAEQARGHEGDALVAVLGALRALYLARDSAGSQARRCHNHLSIASFSRGVNLQLPALPAPEPAITVEHLRTSVDPDQPAARIERATPPTMDLGALTAEVEDTAARVGAAADAVRERRPLIENLADEAEGLAKNHEAILGLEAAATVAAKEAEAEEAEHRQALDALEQAAETWLARVRAWLGDAPSAHAAHLEPFIEPAVAALVEDASMPGRSRTQAQRDLAGAVRAANKAVDAADAAKARIAAQQAETETQIEAVRSGADEGPPRPAHLATREHYETGSAFFRLVEFNPALSASQRAGLEAALHGCGLLDAWVSPDGDIADPDLEDVFASLPAAATAPGSTLADALLALPDAPVPAGVIEALLHSVALTEMPATSAFPLAVSLQGRWHTGPLSGAIQGSDAGYIGKAARAERRDRRLRELGELAERLRHAARSAEEEHRQALAELAAWQEHRDLCPETEGLDLAHSAAESAENLAIGKRRKAEEAEQKYNTAHSVWLSGKHAFQQRATTAGLPDSLDELRAAAAACPLALESLEDLHDTLAARWTQGLADLQRGLEQHSKATSQRSQAEAKAQQACTKHDEAAGALALMLANLDAEGQQIQDTLAELKDELERATGELPGADEAHLEAERKSLESGTRLNNLREKERELAAKVADAEDALTDALDAPGLWLAATGHGDPAPEERDEALTILEATKASAPKATDAMAVHRAHQDARAALPADRDLEIGLTHDILVITAVDDEGTRPVAEIAQRTAARLATEREQMSERYRNIFQDFLLHDLAENLRVQIDRAETLVGRMNEILSGAQSSQGVHVQLSWHPSPAVDDATHAGLALVRKSLATRTPAEDEALRSALKSRIEAEHSAATGDYASAVANALDYRAWHTFTVRVRDTGPDGSPRNRLLKRLSSGETRLISYVTLFAAAAAFYDALRRPATHPLRIVLLDEAFERLDDPTITRLLELLVDLDMDWIITWPGASALSPRIPRLHVYDILKRRGAPGIAFVETLWDGGIATIEG